MSAPAAPKEVVPNMKYIWNKKKIYADAIKQLKKATLLLIVPINADDKMDATKTVPSLIYICTVNNIYIFDLIALKEHKITPEILDIINSNKLKFVYSKAATFKHLQIDNWEEIPNVVDFKSITNAAREKIANDPDGLGANLPQSDFRLADIDWSVRPFKNDEHFKAGKRIHELLVITTL